MSLDDSQEEDCTVYIEQLKSDNPSLKLTAAGKLPVIAAVLGHNRIKDQLIPYIIEIIEQMDNDNDFLIKVTDGLLQLKKFCKTSNELAVLIHPLRILACLDQPPVRDQAINSLKKLVVGQTKDFYEQHYFSLIKSLNNKNGPYSPRVAVCCLIPITYPHVSEQKQEELRKIFKSLALDENSPLVRRALAENIEALGNVIDKKTIRTQLLQIWQKFIVDPIDIIRIKALECAVVIARAFKKEETTENIFKFLKAVDTNKKAWRIRYALIQCLASILNYLEKQIVKKDVVQCFEELLKDSEAEVRAIALIKLPELTSKLSPQQNFTVFFQYFEKAAKDSNKEAAPTVKLALIDAIVPYFKCIEKQKITENGIPILASLLKDENQSIRIGVAQKLADLNEAVGKQNMVKYIIPMLEGCLVDKKWRFKLSIAENITNLFKTLGYDDHKEFLQKIVTTFLKDHNFAVREQTIKCLSQLKDVIGSQKYWQLIQKYFNQLLSEANYIYRVTACTLILQLANALEKKEFNELFLALVKKMEAEKVSNVLITFFTTFAKIKAQVSAQVKKEVQALIKKVQEEKDDEDVLYFAGKSDE